MIPFVDLKAQYQQIKDEVHLALDQVMENTAFILGPSVQQFEESFAKYATVKHAVGANSGTSALHLALHAIGVGDGDEVIVPAMTFVATAMAVDYTNAKPVLVDVDPKTYTMDPAKIEAAITPHTKAIMPVHIYGQPADMDPIMEIARKHSLIVIEDAAQAHGAEYKGRRCGSIGDIAAFSFYPGKNLGAYGEGGAVTTNNNDYADLVRSLRDWGQEGKGNHVHKAYNYRLSGFQGAVLGVKMKYIEEWTEGRRRAGTRYLEMLQGAANIVPPTVNPDVRHVFHVFGVLVKEREAVMAKLQAAGVASGVHYPRPVHLQPCFAELGYKPGDFPVAERLANEELSLPMFGELTDDQIDLVCETLRQATA
ncbi:DegT/DnrJ/EryC1/StrS family aminotransferase [Calditrichota bacterium]